MTQSVQRPVRRRAPEPTPDQIAHLESRKISEQTQAKFGLRRDGDRIGIPILDASGVEVNVRRYLPGAPGGHIPKIINAGQGKGRGTRLFPISVIGASQRNETILIVGGEIDALSAIDAGLTAVCGTNGEGSVARPEDLELLGGRDIAIVLDADRAGRKAAEKWRAQLAPIAGAVHVVALPEGTDVNDWFTSGRTKEELLELVALASGPGSSRPSAGDLLARAITMAEEDGRNNTGFWLACRMRDAGYSAEEAWDEALQLFQSAVTSNKTEPYPEAEARGSLDSAYSQDPRSLAASNGATRRRALTELGNAERLVSAHGDDLRYIPAIGRWYVWDSRRWTDDVSGEAVMRRAKVSARSIAGEAAGLGPKDAAPILSWAQSSESRSRLESTIKLAQSEEGISMMPSQFDADPMSLNVRNGTLDLATCELRPHSREDYNHLMIDVDYSADARAPKFEAFLARIQPDPEVRAFLLRAVGYSLTGRTNEQKLILGHGTGSNGKTTLIEIMHDLFGAYATFLPAEALVQSRGDRIPNDIARLKGARFVSVMEFDDSAPLNERLVKQLTGGDTISARFMRGEFFDFRPQCTIWVSTNHHPIIRGADDGIWRRFLLVPFPVKIPAEEIDSKLRETIRDTELPGILRLAVEGARDWNRIGLNPPASILAATEGYRRASDVLGSFLGEQCLVGVGESVTKGLLYEAYKGWCEEGGLHPATKISFGRMLKERPDLNLEEDKVGKAKTQRWLGLGLAGESPYRQHLSAVGGSDTEKRLETEPLARRARR